MAEPVEDLLDAETTEELAEIIKILQTVDGCVELIGQLQQALETRDVIGQAKGILMIREGITADEAFDILRRASQRSNVKLREVASRVVTAGADPSAPPQPT